MKALIKHAMQRCSIPIVNTIRVVNGLALATNLDISISHATTLEEGLYEPASFGGLNVKSALELADYPINSPAQASEATFTISVDALAWVVKAVSTDGTRYYPNGVYVDATKQRILSTDGHRMHVHTIAGHEGSALSLIIPTAAVKLAISAAKEQKAKSIRIGLSKNRATLTCGAYTIESKIIDGTYPPYERVIPDGNNLSYAWDNKAFLAIYKDIKALVKLKGDVTVKLGCALSTNGHQFEFAPCPVEIGFNHKYLADLASGDMMIGKPRGAVLVTHSLMHFSVLMPMII